MNNVEYSM